MRSSAPPKPASRLERAAWFAACLALLLLAYGPVLTFGRAFAPAFDTLFLTTPMLCEIGAQWRAGRVPLIDWTTFEPTSANLHLSPLYPFYFAPLLDYCTLPGGVAAHDLVGVFHLVLAFGGAALLGRAAGLPLRGALFGALVVAVSLHAFTLAQWPTLIAAFAWLTFAATGLVLVLHRGEWLAGSLLTTAGTGLMLLANPASNLVAPLVVFALLLALGLGAEALRDGSWRRRFGPWLLCGAACAAGVALLGLGSTGNALLALDDLVRWHRAGHVIGRDVPAGLMRELLVEQRPAADILGVALPLHVVLQSAFGVGGFFLGAVGTALAAIGALNGRHDPLIRALALLAAVILFFVFLDPAEWALLWTWVPGVNHTRHLSLFGGAFMLAVGVLAGRGFEAVLEPQAVPLRRALALVLLGAALLVWPLMIWRGAPAFAALIWPAILGPGLLGAALLAFPGRWAAQPRALCSLVLVGWALGVVPTLHVRHDTIANGQALSRSWADLERLVQSTAAQDSEPGVFLFRSGFASDGLDYTTAGTAARLIGVPTFQYYLSPRIHWQFFTLNHRFPDYATYGRLGGRYVFTEGPEDHPLLEPIGQEGMIHAYRIRGGRPLAVSLCLPAPLPEGEPEIEPLLPSQLPRAPVSLTVAAAGADTVLPECPHPPISRLRVDRAAGALRFDLTQGAAQAIVFNLPPHRGWHLRVEGLRLPVYALDHTRMVAAIPPGAVGRARLTFAPEPVILRMVATAVGWLLVLLAAALLAWRALRRRQRGAVTGRRSGDCVGAPFGTSQVPPSPETR